MSKLKSFTPRDDSAPHDDSAETAAPVPADPLDRVESALLHGELPRELASDPANPKRATEEVRRLVRRIWNKFAREGRLILRGRYTARAIQVACLRRELLFRIALRGEDHKLAFEVEKDRCKLLGLYHDDWRKHQGPSDASQDEDQDDVNRLLAEEMAKLAQAGPTPPADAPPPPQCPPSAGAAP